MNLRWSVILTYAGDVCFSSGLLGPDGTSRYLGKWCKRGENKTSNTTVSVSHGSLIAVGSDGRGGRVKVLRSPIHSLVCFYNFISVYHHINSVDSLLTLTNYHMQYFPCTWFYTASLPMGYSLKLFCIFQFPITLTRISSLL